MLKTFHSLSLEKIHSMLSQFCIDSYHMNIQELQIFLEKYIQQGILEYQIGMYSLIHK